MKHPNSIQIQTIDYCNRKCAWCPNSKYEKTPDRLMTGEVYEKILQDLNDMEYKGAIHLYLMGEPLMDQGIIQKVRNARRLFPQNKIFISTNGDTLDECVADQLFNAGLTWMAVSVYDMSNQEELVAVKQKYPEKVVFTSLGQLRATYYNRAGHVPVACISPEEKCNWVQHKAYINYTGKVILCCSDYDYEVDFGNVMETSFAEIYNSDFYNDYRNMHQEGRGVEMPLCMKCNRIISKAEIESSNTPKVRLNIGCGDMVSDNAINIDKYNDRADIMADAYMIPMDGNSVDIIESHHLLEHLKKSDAVKALGEWNRLLKKGGDLFVSVPDIMEICYMASKANGNWNNVMSYLYGQEEKGMAHKYGYSVESFKELLKATGFDVISIDSSTKSRPTPTIYAVGVKK